MTALFPWTDAAIETLSRLWREGRSASHIAALLGCSRNSVIGKAHRSPHIIRSRAWYENNGVTVSVKKVEPQPPEPVIAKPIKPPKPVKELKAAKASALHLARVKTAAKVAAKLARQANAPAPKHGLSIMQLTEWTCRWPVGGDSKLGKLRYCGAGCADGPYCSRHRAIAYIPIQRRLRGAVHV